jgi:hypothetical protein
VCERRRSKSTLSYCCSICLEWKNTGNLSQHSRCLWRDSNRASPESSQNCYRLSQLVQNTAYTCNVRNSASLPIGRIQISVTETSGLIGLWILSSTPDILPVSKICWYNPVKDVYFSDQFVHSMCYLMKYTLTQPTYLHLTWPYGIYPNVTQTGCSET